MCLTEHCRSAARRRLWPARVSSPTKFCGMRPSQPEFGCWKVSTCAGFCEKAGRIVGLADEHKEYRARVTVGADGTRSLLAREMGVVRPIQRLQRLALVTHYQATEAANSEAAVTMHLPRDCSDACCGVGAACGPERTRNVNIVVPVSEAPLMAGRRQAYFEERLRLSFPSSLGAGSQQRADRTTALGRVLWPPHYARNG